MKFTEIPYKVLKDFFLNVPGMAVGTVQNIPTFLIFCSTSDGGSILPAGITTVQSGSTQNFVFYPDTANGYFIDSVIVDGVNVGTPSSYSFTNILSDHTLVVNFVNTPDSLTITSSVLGGEGTIIPLGSVSVSAGESQTFTILPSAGYVIDSILVDGEEI
jgi:hypothetical protein